MKQRFDRQCIGLFVSFLAQIGQPVSGVDAWPEDEMQGEIDAIAGPYAIQHTSVDSLPNHRLKDHQFLQVVEGIEAELRDKLGYRIVIQIDWNAVQTKQDWPRTRTAIRRWLLGDASTLPDGKRPVCIDDVPFPLTIIKGGPIKTDGVYFQRTLSQADESLAARLRDQLVGRHDKLTVLAAHRRHGRKTLLLLESDDIALMDNVRMGQAFEEAFPTWPESLDELWFVHQTGQAEISDLQRGHTWLYDPSNNAVVEHNDCSFKAYTYS